VIQRDGQVAEADMRDALDRYNLSAELFNSVGKSYFQGQAQGMGDAGFWSATFNGTVTDIGAQAAAIMKIEGEYGPEVRRAREKVVALFNQQQRLLTSGKKLSDAARSAE